MTVSIRLPVPQNHPAPEGAGMFELGPRMSPEEGYAALAAKGPQRPDVFLFDLGDGSTAGMVGVDFHLDVALLPDMDTGNLKGATYPRGFRATFGKRVVVGIPKDAPILFHAPATGADAYRTFGRHETPCGPETIEMLSDLADEAGFELERDAPAGKFLDRLRLDLSGADGSRAFADVASAILGHRRVLLDGKGIDGRRRQTWIAMADGVTEHDLHHVAPSGFGAGMDAVTRVGRAERPVSLSPATADEVAELLVTSPMHRLAIAWLDEAPIDSFRSGRIPALRDGLPERSQGVPALR